MNVVPANLAEPPNGFPAFSRGALPTWQKDAARLVLLNASHHIKQKVTNQ
jgi:hypothetical protein